MSLVSSCVGVGVCICVPKVESCEKAIKPIQFLFYYFIYIMLYHIVRTIFEWWCGDKAPAWQALLWRVHRQRKPLAECCHNISIRQIYGHSFCWGMTLRSLLYFSSSTSVMSCLFSASIFCFVRWYPLLSLRAVMRRIFDLSICSIFTLRAETCNLG